MHCLLASHLHFPSPDAVAQDRKPTLWWDARHSLNRSIAVCSPSVSLATWLASHVTPQTPTPRGQPHRRPPAIPLPPASCSRVAMPLHVSLHPAASTADRPRCRSRSTLIATSPNAFRTRVGDLRSSRLRWRGRHPYPLPCRFPSCQPTQLRTRRKG